MDVQKFLAASFAAREADVSVPALADFFGKDKPVWRVRGLTASELARARESKGRDENLRALIKAMSGDGDKAAELRKSLGLGSDEVPGDISQRIEMLAMGSVSPEIGDDNRDVAVKLAESFPVTFYEVTNKIHELTGQGAALGKPKRSGKTKASE